jgi:tRNA G10  N-methylase Trm11
MRLFYSTCPAGLEEPCRRLAAKAVPGFSAKGVFPGALVYSARTEKPECAGFSNTYLQIARVDKCGAVTHAAKLFLQDKRALMEAERSMKEYGFESFRVMFSDANRLASVENAYREAFERLIRVKNNRTNPDTELMVLRRSDGCGLLLMRLSRPTHAKKGELSPAVASCMAYLAKPEAGGAFMDPFAGSGAIGVARMSLRRSKRIFLSDLDGNAVAKLRKRIPGRAEIEQLDALKLADRFGPGEFTEIVTDPPWGLFKALNADAGAFCRSMLENFQYALAPYGSCVVLTAMKSEFADAVRKSDLELMERFDILVNGKKAAVFVLRKPGPSDR